MSENLFACSHCFKRFPFHKLTEDNHYCEACYLATLRRCRVCLIYYSPRNKTMKTCRACSWSIKNYGGPRRCDLCKLKAAFQWGKCKRCHNYCRKYGSPRKCSGCKCRAAFIKSRADLQMHKRLLCWLCDHNLTSLSGGSDFNSIQESNERNSKNNKSGILINQFSQLLSPLVDNTTSTSMLSSPSLSTKSLATASTELKVKQSPSSIALCETSMNSINSDKTLASGSGCLKERIKCELPDIEFPEGEMLGGFSNHFLEISELKDTVSALKKRLDIQNKHLEEKNTLMKTLGAEMQAKEACLLQQLRDVNNRDLQQFQTLNRQMNELTKENVKLKKAMKARLLKKPNEGSNDRLFFTT